MIKKNKLREINYLFMIIFLIFLSCNQSPEVKVEVSTESPESTIRIVFVHHSCGNNWLSTGNGNLGDTLGVNNYYVRDTYYGWGRDI